MASTIKRAGYLLETEQIIVPIEKELHSLESYVSIQQARATYAFEMQWDVPPELRTYCTVKLLFQPILENSIQHGFIGKKKWLLRFKLRKYENHLIISVTDNGIGIEKSELEKLIKKLQNTDMTVEKHIGLFNSNRRLQLLFGEDYYITIKSKKNIGTQVCLKLPILTETT